MSVFMILTDTIIAFMDKGKKMKNRLMIKGSVVIRNADTGEILAENHNMVVARGRTAILELVAGITNVGVTWLALGPSSTTPADTDYKLGSEACRSQLIEKTVSGDSIILSTFFNGGGAGVNSVFEEAGLFGGSGAGATINSGTLYAHTLVSFDNSSANNLTATWTLTLSNQ